MTNATGCQAIWTMPWAVNVSVSSVEFLSGYASTVDVHGFTAIVACKMVSF